MSTASEYPAHLRMEQSRHSHVLLHVPLQRMLASHCSGHVPVGMAD